MSTKLDSKIVELELDNKNFESNAKQSIGTLDSLKEHMDFSGVEAGLQEVTVKFNALEVAAVTAIKNITDRIVNAAIQWKDSLSTDQITAGWDKYAQKTTSVQTILNATGRSMDDVNKTMDNLMWFSDETSYSFTDMANNIGKFTSSNIGLEESANAMKGIALEAALAGQNTTVAARSMYNFAQSLAAGSVQAIDWRSIELANMATTEFKQTIIDTAVELGTLNSKAQIEYRPKGYSGSKQVTAENFRETLAADWFTSDVLIKALDKYGAFSTRLAEVMNENEIDIRTSEMLNYIDEYIDGTIDWEDAMDDTGLSAEKLDKILKELSSDEYELGRRAMRAGQEAKTFQEAIDATKDAVSSEWLKTFELIFGDYETARVLWTDLANTLWDVFAESLSYRNDVLREWNTMDVGGQQDFIQALRNILTAVSNFFNVFHEVKSEMSFFNTDLLSSVTLKFKAFSERLVENTENTDKLRDKIKGFLNIVQGIKTVFAGIWAVVKPILSFIYESGKELLTDIFGKIGEKVSLDGKEVTITFDDISKKVTDFLNKIKDIAKGAWAVVKPILNSIYKVGKSIVTDVLDKIRNKTEEDGTTFSEKMDAVAAKLQPFLDTLTTKIKDVTAAIGDFIATLFEDGGFFSKVGGFFSSLFPEKEENEAVTRTLTLTDKAEDATDKLSIVRDNIHTFQEKGDDESWITKALQKISDILSDITRGGLSALINQAITVTEVLKDRGEELFDALADLTVTFLEAVKRNAPKLVEAGGDAILTIAEGIADYINDNAERIAGILDTFVEGLSKIIGPFIKKISDFLGVDVDQETIENIVNVVIKILLAVAASITIMDSIVNKIWSASYIQSFFDYVIDPIGEFAEGLESIGRSMKLKQVNKLIMAIVAAVIASVAAIWLLAKTINDYGVKNFIVAVVVVHTIIAAFAAILIIISKLYKNLESVNTKSLKAINGFILSIAATILAFGAAVAMILKNLPAENGIGVLLTIVGSVIGLFVVIGLLLLEISDIKIETSKLLTVTGAMVLMLGAMSSVMVIFSLLDPTAVLPVAIAAAALFAVMVAGFAILSTVDTTGIIEMAGAFAIFSTALIAISAAFLVFTQVDLSGLIIGLVAIAGSIVLFAAAALLLSPVIELLYAFSTAFAVFGVAILAMGAGILLIVEAVILFINCMTDLGVSVEELKSNIKEVLDAIFESISKFIGNTILQIGQAFLDLIQMFVDNHELIYEGLVTLLAMGLEALIAIIPALCEAVVLLIESLLKVISEHFPTMLGYIIDLIVGATETLAERLPDLVQAGIDLFVSLLETLANSMVTNGKAINKSIIDLTAALISTIIESLNPIHLGELFGKVSENLFGKNLWDAFVAKLDALKDKLWDKIKNIGEFLIAPFKKVGSFFGDLFGTGKDEFEKAADINSPSGVMREEGNYIGEGLILGVKDKMSGIEDASENMADSMIDPVSDAVAQVEEMAEEDMDSEMILTPVLDLTKVKEGLASFRNMTGFLDSSSITGNINTSQNLGTDISANAPTFSSMSSKMGDLAGFANKTINFENVFNITSSDPEGVADEVSSILQRQVEREETVWE